MRNVLVAAIALCACRPPMTNMAYVPQKTTTQLGRADLRRVVVEYVLDSGWQLLDNSTDGKVVAVTPIEMTSGVATRQIWTFDVGDFQVTASLRFEAQFDEGKWTSSPEVCSGYQYLREHIHLDAIASRAAGVPSVETTYAWRTQP